jgi:hypothetical protein
MTTNFAVTINVSTVSGNITTATFDKAMIFTKDTPASGVTFNKGDYLLYENLASVGSDWGTSSNTYKMAAALLSPSLKVKDFYIYRREDEVAIVKTITFSDDFITGNEIDVTINGIALDTVTYDTSHAATLTALASEIQGAEFINTASGSVRTITITADAGSPLNIDVAVSGGVSQPTVTTAISTAGFTIADDIGAALEAGVNFFWVLETSHDKGTQLIAAETSNANSLYFGLSSNESDMKDNTDTDIAALIYATSNPLSFGFYSSTASNYPEAAAIGRCVPKGNGQTSFAYKELVGQTTDNLTSTERSNLLAKNCNYYVENGGANVTHPGLSFAGDPIEAMWDILYLKARSTENCYRVLVTNDKIPYTQAGFNIMGGALQKTINQMIDQGVIAPFDPDTGIPPIVSIPNIKDVSAGDRAAHRFTGFSLTAYYLAAGKSMTADITVII